MGGHRAWHVLGRVVPWIGTGARPIQFGRWGFLWAPFTAVHLLTVLLLFSAYQWDPHSWSGLPRRWLLFHIAPDTIIDFGRNWVAAVPAPWILGSWAHVWYVWTFFLLFAWWFEVFEGTKRTVAVFYGVLVPAGLMAMLVQWVLWHGIDGGWTPAAWHWIVNDNRQAIWFGGSVSAYGFVGAAAARARWPWLLLVALPGWDIFGGTMGYFRPFTTIMHETACLSAFLWVRFRWPRPWSGAPASNPVDREAQEAPT